MPKLRTLKPSSNSSLRLLSWCQMNCFDQQRPFNPKVSFMNHYWTRSQESQWVTDRKVQSNIRWQREAIKGSRWCNYCLCASLIYGAAPGTQVSAAVLLLPTKQWKNIPTPRADLGLPPLNFHTGTLRSQHNVSKRRRSEKKCEHPVNFDTAIICLTGRGTIISPNHSLSHLSFWIWLNNTVAHQQLLITTEVTAKLKMEVWRCKQSLNAAHKAFIQITFLPSTMPDKTRHLNCNLTNVFQWQNLDVMVIIFKNNWKYNY